MKDVYNKNCLITQTYGFIKQDFRQWNVRHLDYDIDKYILTENVN